MTPRPRRAIPLEPQYEVDESKWRLDSAAPHHPGPGSAGVCEACGKAFNSNGRRRPGCYDVAGRKPADCRYYQRKEPR